MASKMSQMIFLRLKPSLLRLSRSQTSLQPTSKRTVTYTNTGALLPEPTVMRLGVVRVLVTVLPFLYVGATIGKEGAAFMEENDIFVPDDDDDD